MDKGNNNLEKNHMSFLDKILNELSELDFSNIKNLMVVILGITSPLVPLIFLYRRDLLKELELTGVLILALIINSILIIFNTIIYKIKERKELELRLIRAEISFENTKELINSYELLRKSNDNTTFLNCIKKELSNIDVLDENNQLYIQLDKIEKAINNEEQISEKVDNNLEILINTIVNISLRLEQIKNKKSYESESFEMAFLNNIVIGLIVIIVKLFSYLNIYNMSLKNLIIVIVCGYCGGMLIFVSTMLKLKYNEIRLKRISKSQRGF